MKMINRWLAIAATGALGACAALPVPKAPTLVPPPLPQQAFSNELRLSTVIARMQPSDAILNVQYGWACLPAGSRALQTNRLPVIPEDMTAAFKAVLEPLRYKIERESESVFVPRNGPAAELLVGATVKRIEASLCFPFVGSPALNVGDPSLVKGKLFAQVTWEIFSVSRGAVVYTGTTEGTFEIDRTVTGGVGTMVLNAFMVNLANLAANDEFRTHVQKPPVPSRQAAPLAAKP